MFGERTESILSDIVIIKMLLFDLFIGIGRIRFINCQLHVDRSDLCVVVRLKSLHLCLLDNAGETQVLVEPCDIGAECDPVHLMGFEGFFAGDDLTGALLAGESHEIIVIAEQGMFLVPADRALGNTFRRAYISVDYKIFAFLGPLAVIFSDLIDFLIQFVQLFLIILIL